MVKKTIHELFFRKKKNKGKRTGSIEYRLDLEAMPRYFLYLTSAGPGAYHLHVCDQFPERLEYTLHMTRRDVLALENLCREYLRGLSPGEE